MEMTVTKFRDRRVKKKDKTLQYEHSFCDVGQNLRRNRQFEQSSPVGWCPHYGSSPHYGLLKFQQ